MIICSSEERQIWTFGESRRKIQNSKFERQTRLPRLYTPMREFDSTCCSRNLFNFLSLPTKPKSYLDRCAPDRQLLNKPQRLKQKGDATEGHVSRTTPLAKGLRRLDYEYHRAKVFASLSICRNTKLAPNFRGPTSIQPRGQTATNGIGSHELALGSNPLVQRCAQQPHPPRSGGGGRPKRACTTEQNKKSGLSVSKRGKVFGDMYILRLPSTRICQIAHVC